MSQEPIPKRVTAFVDGQNLFHAARYAFQYSYPNYDAKQLAEYVCRAQGWQLGEVRFYTGVPAASDNPRWNGFWTKKLSRMGRQGVRIYSRSLVYRTKSVDVPGFGPHSFVAGEEKGIDVRLALDALDGAHRGEYDVALIFSQDQDLSELAELIRQVARFQRRWIKIASAFPDGPDALNHRGIDRTDWFRIDRAAYDACVDPADYRS
jgi:uncharacterized LabA/DUF88 family protein